jgi:hypothetical protein
MKNNKNKFRKDKNGLGEIVRFGEVRISRQSK